MGGCCNKFRKKEEEPKGMIPDEQRKCNDVCCFILFIIFWIGMIVVAAISVSSGDPKRLLYGVDYKGEVCGSGVNEGKKRIVYPRMTEDLLLNMEGGIIKANPLDYKFYGICVTNCPYAGYVLCNDDAKDITDAKPQANLSACFNYPRTNEYDCPIVRSNCWLTPLNMSSVFWRCLPDYIVTKDSNSRCVMPQGVKDPNDPACVVKVREGNDTLTQPAQPNLLFDKINQARTLWGRWVGDVARSWWVTALCGVVLALLFGLFWLLLLRFCAAVMVFITILLVFALMIGFTFFCYAKAGILDPTFVQDALDEAGDAGGSVSQKLVPSEENKTKFKYAAYTMTVLTIVLLLVIFGIRQSIINAVHIISQGAKALQKNFGLVFYPLITVTAIFALLVYFVFVGAAMMSAGDNVSAGNMTSVVASNLAKIQEKYPSYTSAVNITAFENQALRVLEPLTATRYLFAYHFFGLLWTMQVIQGIGMVTIAGVIAHYYFHKGASAPVAADAALAAAGDDGAAAKPKKRSILCMSLKRALCKSFGSIVFGSLLIAIVQFVRVVFNYIENQLKSKAGNNQASKFLIKVINCCLCFLEMCLKFITRNAFIYMAVKGTSFLTSAAKSVALILANAIDLAVVNTIGEILMLLGKLFVTCTCAFMSYLLMNNLSQFQEDGDEALTSKWLPVLMTMIFAFFVASAFFYVLDIAIDTILLCFCIDKKENNGVPVHMTLEGVVGKRALATRKAQEGAEPGVQMTNNPAGGKK